MLSGTTQAPSPSPAQPVSPRAGSYRRFAESLSAPSPAMHTAWELNLSADRWLAPRAGWNIWQGVCCCRCRLCLSRADFPLWSCTKGFSPRYFVGGKESYSGLADVSNSVANEPVVRFDRGVSLQTGRVTIPYVYGRDQRGESWAATMACTLSVASTRSKTPVSRA